MSVKVFLSACASHCPPPDSATYTRTSVHATTFLPTYYVTFINIHIIQFATQKRITESSKQQVQLLNLPTVLLRKYEMGSTCNMYGLEEQCIQDFDVET
jgi:hypothetical protein